MYNALLGEVMTKNSIEVFFAIICSQNLNFGMKLPLHHGMKDLENRTHFRFVFHKEYPCKSRMIVNKRYEPMCASNVSNPRRPPHTTMNQGKRRRWSVGLAGISTAYMFRELTNFTLKIMGIFIHKQGWK